MKKTIRIGIVLFHILLITNILHAQISSSGSNGEKWGLITADLYYTNGFVDITESEDTFRNKRFDVIFIDPNGVQTRVPGYYAADINAKNTGATQGQWFRAVFRPYMEGDWTIEGYYYEGTDVATMSVSELPEPSFFYNEPITPAIGASSKVLPNLSVKGRLQYSTTGTNSERRYLKFAETGEYFLKIGPDSPENLLDYEDFDFDDVRSDCGGDGKCFEHKFIPHANDYVDGDPTWSGDRGKNIMGALNYIKNQGMNSISMSLFGGDDENVFPWVTRDNPYIFDVSKLEQWEVVFNHAEANGLLLHFKLAESENWNVLNENQLRLFYREMVARFGHHLAIEWNISEEYGAQNSLGTAASAINRINWLAEIDPYNSPRVIHTFPGEHDKYQDWLNLNANLTGASVQSPKIEDNPYSDPDAGFLSIINASKNSGTPWVVACDEQGPGFTGVFTNFPVSVTDIQEGAREQYIWEQFIAGGAGVMWYGGAVGDFQTEDFRRFDTLFNWSKHAVDFFKSNAIEFWNMENRDDLVTGVLPKCLANSGNDYVIYLKEGGTTELNLSGLEGNFTIKWFDPRNGGMLQNGSKTTLVGGTLSTIGNPPNNTTEDWVAYVTFSDNPIASGRTIPGFIEAEDYDSKVNLLEVDIVDEGDAGVSMGYSNNISELTYEVNVEAAGEYTMNIRVGTPFGGRRVIVFSNDIEIGTIDVPNTGGWANYQTLSTEVTFDTAGTQILKLDYDGPAGPQYNLNWIEFTQVSTPILTGQPIPGLIEAESYDTKVNLLEVDIVDEGESGVSMGYSNNISELTYEVNVTEPGEYEVGIRVASPFGGRQMIIKSNGIELGTIAVPSTGAWSNYETYTTNVTFDNTGTQILKLEYDGPSGPQFNFNWIEFSSTTILNPNECDLNYTLEALTFPNIDIDGFRPAYKDTARQSLAINSIVYPDEFAAAETVFSGNSGTYDITINTLTEDDGESTYRVSVDNVLIGEYQNPASSTNFEAAGTTFESIFIDNGAVIRVEFNAVSNGTKPLGDGFDYSRGRFRSLELTCVDEVVVPDPIGIPIPALIEAEDYDSKINLLEVDIVDEGESGVSMGYSNNISELTYQIYVENPGNYTVGIRVGTPFGGRSMTISSNDIELTTIAIPNTGGWSNYQTLTANVTFDIAGTQILKLNYDGPSGPQYNLNWIEFLPVSSAKQTISKNINTISEAVKIYPNPASTALFIKGNKGQRFVIVDITGREVIKNFVTNTSLDRIDISILPEGIYFVKIDTSTFKLLIKR